jgi:thiamine pyrophosphokinase
MCNPKFRNPVVVVANGSFPQHVVPVKALQEAGTIVCCDGAAAKLTAHGLQPDFIVGDMDSITPADAATFANILYPSPEQETNDLTKAVNFCVQHGVTHLTIVGATGERDDHTLGNIALLAKYATQLQHVEMLTNHGRFMPLLSSTTCKSYAGQQVSIFCLTPDTQMEAEGLKYSLRNVVFDAWWKGTLNEALGNSFRLTFDKGKVLLFCTY